MPGYYATLASVASYFFVFIAVLLVIKTIKKVRMGFKGTEDVEHNEEWEAVEDYYDNGHAEEYEGDYLKIIDNNGIQKVNVGDVFFLDTENIIGRRGDCDIVIADPTVSSQHAGIYLDGRHYYLVDLGSKNGTYVNNRRIKRDYKLKDGDIINVGNILIMVVLN
ncbi:MAG TPA: FHA domain-containing protein [Clostridiales bacterium]|nr:FHA domain-containing protein [Clostridiales bacterium]